MDRQALEKLVRNSSVATDAERILALARPAIRLRKEVCDLEQLSLGESHLGRVVDSDEEQGGNPYETVAQIDCAALPPEAHAFLPSTGWLVFQWEGTGIWGYQPEDRGGFAVTWFDCDRAALVRFVDDDDNPPEVRRVSFSVDWLLPEWGASTLSIDEDTYRSLLDEIAARSEVDTFPDHLLGHIESAPQGWLEETCELVRRGRNIFSNAGGAPADGEAAAHERANWQLLLQVEGDDELGFDWSGGTVGFFIRREDLDDRTWDRAWLVFQR